jgi:hypothetical protein
MFLLAAKMMMAKERRVHNNDRNKNNKSMTKISID